MESQYIKEKKLQRSKNKKEIYDFLVKSFETTMCMPTMKEIVANTSVKSTSTVYMCLNSLFDDGLVGTPSGEKIFNKYYLTSYKVVKKENG